MPTVLRQSGYRFYFYSHEPFEPPHVHVDRGGASAKFWLENVALSRNHGYAATELAEIMRIVKHNRDALLEAWHGYFGT